MEEVFLKINNFGCERKEITIEIHESGNELFIKREVYAEGKFKDLVCRIRLPVQVVEGQVSCKFNPNEKSGQLSLKISNQSPSEFVGRYEICEFPLEADENATEDNMELNINQTDDFFVFEPKNRLKSMARASIALDNKQLIFLVTYESVAKTRKITLPMGISLNQIVVENAPIGKKSYYFEKTTHCNKYS